MSLYFILFTAFLTFSKEPQATVLLSGPNVNPEAQSWFLEKNMETISFAYHRFQNPPYANYESEALDRCLDKSSISDCQVFESAILSYPLTEESINILAKLPFLSDLSRKIVQTHSLSSQITPIPQDIRILVKNGRPVLFKEIFEISSEVAHWSIFANDSEVITLVGRADQAHTAYENRKRLIDGNCAQFQSNISEKIDRLKVFFSPSCVKSPFAFSKFEHDYRDPTSSLPLAQKPLDLKPKNYVFPALVSALIVSALLKSQGKKIELTWP